MNSSMQPVSVTTGQRKTQSKQSSATYHCLDVFLPSCSFNISSKDLLQDCRAHNKWLHYSWICSLLLMNCLFCGKCYNFCKTLLIILQPCQSSSLGRSWCGLENRKRDLSKKMIRGQSLRIQNVLLCWEVNHTHSDTSFFSETRPLLNTQLNQCYSGMRQYFLHHYKILSRA